MLKVRGVTLSGRESLTCCKNGLKPEDNSPFFNSGKTTRGYDPSQDVVWLRSEIEKWILGNLMEKWSGYIHLLLSS